jgi:hypothetical protein
LILDKLGYVRASKVGAEPLFDVIGTAETDVFRGPPSRLLL